MAGRYVLKDLSGALRGYLVLEEMGMRCSASLLREAELVLLRGDETVSGMMLEAGTGERFLPLCERGITGGYVADQTGLVLVTDATAHSAWLKRTRTKPQTDCGCVSAPSERKEQRQAERYVEENNDRRWPPPPCMPGACYIRGRWVPELRESEG